MVYNSPNGEFHLAYMMGIVFMTRLASVLRTPALLAGITLFLSSNSAQAALSTTKGTSDDPGGLIWVYFAAFILGTLGLAFMPGKRKEAE